MAEWLGMTKSCPQAFLYDELAEAVWWARGLCSKARCDCCPVSSTGLCVLRFVFSVGCSDCQVGSCATAQMDRVKTAVLLILNAKEILVHEK